MNRDHVRWCLGFSILLALVTTLPYLMGFTRDSEAWCFTGFVFAVEDGNSYIAKMLQGASGAWLFQTPYTAEMQRGVLAFLPYILLGKLASPPELHTQLVAIFHLFRVLAIPFLVFATYQFAEVFLTSESWRRWAVVVSTAGGGLGWVLLLWNASGPLEGPPLEFYSPESFGFLALFGIPHLIVARGLFLLALTNYLRGAKSRRRAWSAGVFLLAMGLFQPITIVTSYAVIGAHQALLGIRFLRSGGMEIWRPWLRAAVQTALIPLPFVLYNLWRFSTDDYLRRWALQNVIRSPAPAQYLLSYGLLLVPAIAGVWICWRHRAEARRLMLVAWVLILPALAYFPHNLQRRLPDGAWVALTVLAAIGLDHWLAGRKPGPALGISLAGASLFSSLVLIVGGLGAASNRTPPVFRDAEEVVAFQWIGEHASPGDVVLAAYSTGNAMPAWAPVRVLIGHGPESADLARMQTQVEGFFADEMGPPEREQFLARNRVDWIFWGPAERAFGSMNPPGAVDGLLAYDRGGYFVFAVPAP